MKQLLPMILRFLPLGVFSMGRGKISQGCVERVVSGSR